MTAGFEAIPEGEDSIKVAYEDYEMGFFVYLTVEEAEELVRSLKHAIKEAKS